MYDATGGEIFIYYRAFQSYYLDSMREQIGFVPQDVFLFSDTIRNNISFGIKEPQTNKEELQARIKQAAKDAVIYDHIVELPNGLNTMIGERGITLSGGQKQRVSIA